MPHGKGRGKQAGPPLHITSQFNHLGRLRSGGFTEEALHPEFFNGKYGKSPEQNHKISKARQQPLATATEKLLLTDEEKILFPLLKH